MLKRIILGGLGLILSAVFACPAFADQSIAFKQYFNEGVKAFKEHDDDKALHCFKIAQIYDPNDEELNKYLSILEQRKGGLELQNSQSSIAGLMVYRHYLDEGIKAYQAKDNEKAVRNFKLAKIFYPDSIEADRFLTLMANEAEQSIQIVTLPTSINNVTHQLEQSSTSLQQNLPSMNARPEIVMPQAVVPVAVVPQPAVYVSIQKAKGPATLLSLAQITNNGQVKPKLQIELNSTVIFEGRNIQRFLVVDEGFIGVNTITPDRLKVDALKIGTTFLHIWDETGRYSIYLEVIFPKTTNSASLTQAMNGIHHSQPFTAIYSNDWSTFYSGKNIPGLKRQSYDFNQTLGLTGETPYGFFDASGSYTDFDSISQFDTYTMGLSQIPLEGTSNFNLRAFDALRYLSPLTMPGTRLRGAFADVDLMGDILGLSVSHGQEQVPLGFLSEGESQFNDSYIDAAKITLFPKSNTDRYSLNLATAYGPDRQPYLSDHVYSVEGQHKFNNFTTLNAEEASDGSHDSTLASLKWEDGGFKTGLNFRNIDKDYSTISTLPANQGETGAAWTTEEDYKNITASSFLEAYQDHLYSNPDDTSALNYDANGHIRANITQNSWSDTDFNFVDTAGELSPQRSLALNERLSRSFGIWNSLRGTVFGGVGYQNSHSSDSDISDYDREDVIAGVQLPLTNHISSYANYEFDWLDQPGSGGNSNPSVVNAGLEYQRQLNPKFTFNSQLDYRDELGVKANNSSFLSGEESVIVTCGFSYNPTADVSIFADGDASKILSHIGNPSYDDFEVHLGMRITFGGATYWDPLGTVSGFVFKDRSGDGKYSQGEEGIAGVKLKVGDKEVITDKRGHYSVQIRAKGVDVVPVLDTIPGGLIFSTPETLNVQVLQGRISHADFGLTSQTGIYGIVFVDKNGTGIPNDGDKFIGKVKVVLDGNIIQKSDPHGAFYFRKVSPGVHTITIDINSLAINMLPTVKLKNTIDVAEGTNYMFNIPVQVKQAEGGEN